MASVIFSSAVAISFAPFRDASRYRTRRIFDQPRSRSAWVFPTTLTAGHQTVIARGSSTNNTDTWWMGVAGGEPRFWSHGAHLLQGGVVIRLNE